VRAPDVLGAAQADHVAMHSDLHQHLAKALVAERLPPRHPQPRTARRGLLALLRRA
jgi:hypothetical protein